MVSSSSFLPLPLHHVDRGHDHAGRAEAALQAMMLAEGFLHRMQLAVLGETLDRHHIGTVAGNGERRAGLHGLAVDMDHAGAALAGVAADMCAGQTKLVPQELDQQRAAFDFAAHRLPVHFHRNSRHRPLLPYRPGRNRSCPVNDRRFSVFPGDLSSPRAYSTDNPGPSSATKALIGNILLPSA